MLFEGLLRMLKGIEEMEKDLHPLHSIIWNMRVIHSYLIVDIRFFRNGKFKHLQKNFANVCLLWIMHILQNWEETISLNYKLIRNVDDVFNFPITDYNFAIYSSD